MVQVNITPKLRKNGLAKVVILFRFQFHQKSMTHREKQPNTLPQQDLVQQNQMKRSAEWPNLPTVCYSKSDNYL